MILGGDDFVGVVALSGEVDVGHVFIEVDAPLHSGFHSSFSAGFHLMAINI